MNVSAPHFLLFSESGRTLDRNRWRFVLESFDGSESFEAADVESDTHGERLELLAVVRGLEALPGPSRVTLVTPSRYVNRGLSYGLAEWRSNDWQWEHFGEMAPIKNRDLWQRVDRALTFHEVDCRTWRFDEEPRVKGSAEGETAAAERLLAAKPQAVGEVAAANSTLEGPHYLRSRRSEGAVPSLKQPRRSYFATESETVSTVKSAERSRKRGFLGCSKRWIRAKLWRSLREFWESVCQKVGRLGTRLVPPPWM
jgi:ribonuclease HI